MIINKKNISVDDAIKFSDYEKLLLKRRDNNILLSDYHIEILKRNGIDYSKFSTVRELLFEIENFLDDDYDDELDMLSSQLSEYIYYNETKK